MAGRPEIIRLVELHEREARTFPREELFDNQGRSLVLPETRALSAVELKDVQDGVQLRTLGLIGYLPLTSNIVLNVRPKFPIGNLWEMLSVADEAYERVLPVLRAYERTNASAPHQLLARAFCHYLREILTLGVSRGYFRLEERGHYKPKVNFGRTLSKYLSRGDDVNVSSDTHSFSARRPANAVLKSACISFLRLMPNNNRWLEERALMREALNTLHLVPEAPMHFGDEVLSDVLPMWVQGYYHGALTIYSMLLGYTKVGFGYEAQGCVMPSFLFRLDDIFESFVRNTLRENMRSAGFSIVDGNLPRHQIPLFKDNRAFPIKPDIIFRVGKTLSALGEAKYKPKIEESDRYQVISHVVASEAPFGIWFSPALNEQDAGLQYVGALPSGVKFYHYRLNLMSDVNKASMAMSQTIAQLLEASSVLAA